MSAGFVRSLRWYRVADSPTDAVSRRAVSTWHQMGKPAAFRLAEVGPGRGTLMQDLLRAVKRFPDCYAACVGVHLVETSPALQAIQVDTLDAVYRSGAVPPRSASRRKGKAGRKGPGGDTNDGEQERKMQLKDGKPVEWHPLLGLVPMEEPLLLVAQELFDALPVHQFEMTEAGVWRERLVDVAEPESRHHLRVVLAPGPTPALQGFLAALARNSAEDGVGSDRAGGSASDVPSHAEGDSCTSRATRVRAMADRVAADGLDAVATPGAKPGDAVEFSPAASALAHEVGARIAESGGAACFIDYGYDGSRGLSLRGIRDHKFVDPLSNPGDTDLVSAAAFHHTLRPPRTLILRCAERRRQLRRIAPSNRRGRLPRLGSRVAEHVLADTRYRRAVRGARRGRLGGGRREAGHGAAAVAAPGRDGRGVQGASGDAPRSRGARGVWRRPRVSSRCVTT